jgi:hypothetical protein
LSRFDSERYLGLDDEHTSVAAWSRRYLGKTKRPSRFLSASVHSLPPRPGAEAGPDRKPSARPVDYGALNVLYATAVGVLAIQSRRGDAEQIDIAELVPIGLAAFSLSKAIAREKIGTWVREPFVDETAAGPRPKGRRFRRALGELVTCTRCVGAWSSLGIVGLRLMHPRTGRTATSVLATAAINDFLQGAFQALCGAANELNASSNDNGHLPGDR